MEDANVMGAVEGLGSEKGNIGGCGERGSFK